MEFADGPMGHALGVSAQNAEALSTCFGTSYAGIIAFMAVATEGSFAKAGDKLGIGRSAISRSVQRLENQLCTRLFTRTTRASQLTREGHIFFESCQLGVNQIFAGINEIANLRDGPPRGVLRVSAPVAFGRNIVAPLLTKFSTTYPDIALELVLNDQPPDFASDRIDVAFRNGHVEDSSIVARQVFPMQLVLCASRAYVRKHGEPATINELCHHDCINLRFPSGRLSEWEFKVDGHSQRYVPEAKLIFNDADLVLRAVLDGRGIAQLGAYQARDHLKRNELLMLLGRHVPDDRGHYICYVSRRHLPPRSRVFIDFMIDEIRGRDQLRLEELCLNGSPR
ncbi:LysR family transcriptional regulator [Cupriavidus pauculus]|uniref:LysR family transcriptional regulator n=1 Tax=Cupriavidus pauculus TaxID=82633 RepID=A0A2N5CBC8_9BURK|nr:LysR family transcriptional regulator [Cupriavidus pauculus]PLP99471.1 LysR family transcriptional regulator [Cupriavidus pauculus]